MCLWDAASFAGEDAETTGDLDVLERTVDDKTKESPIPLTSFCLPTTQQQFMLQHVGIWCCSPWAPYTLSAERHSSSNSGHLIALQRCRCPSSNYARSPNLGYSQVFWMSLWSYMLTSLLEMSTLQFGNLAQMRPDCDPCCSSYPKQAAFK